jgi:beta-N-acetylhexosaminidase
MKRFLKITLPIFFLILIAGLIAYKIPYKYRYQKTKNLDEGKLSEEEKILSQLTLEQKIGQLFIIGIEEKNLTPKVENLIKEIHPGGILLLKRNIEGKEQLKELISSLQKISLEDTGLPLFVVVDQEGGIIFRIEWVEKTPQSEIENPEQAYLIGKERGEGLAELGVNLNLAPLLDTTSPGDFIFERSFQKDSETIGTLSEEIIRGQKETGILVAIKHFPGYGGIFFNPEEKIATLEEVPEISQFQKAVAALPEFVMVSNVIYKEIDGKLPFAFSEKGIQFLKNEVQGDCLLISDDLAQNSLLDEFSLKEIVALPIKAGVDVLTFSGWRTPVIGGVLAFREAVESGEVAEDRINQSVLKIIKLKQKLLE